MLKPELKTKWCAALRSGEYKQGICSLYNIEEDGSHSYCCLGVLNSVRDVSQSYIGFPRLIGDWTVLARMNDEEGKTFAEIADYIEEIL